MEEHQSTIEDLEELFGVKTPGLREDFVDLEALNGFEQALVYSKWGVSFFWSA
jgi:hypothetical protein